MHQRTVFFLNKKNVIYMKQIGFRENYTATHVLVSLIEIIKKAIGNKQFMYGLFIDWQKAFDTVDYKILLERLSHSGIRSTANK